MAEHQDSLRGKEKMYILVVGNAFTGKSALINKMTGKGEAEEHEERVDEQRKLETIDIDSYNYSVEGVAATFLDTPGLHGGKYDDIKYIRYMKEKGCDKADLILYCIKMSNTRFQQEDRETITNLTKELGKGIWKNAVFVLTFANDVVALLERKHKHRPDRKPVNETFKEVISTWKKVLSAEVEKIGIHSKVAKSIPVVPAGYEVSDKLYLEDDTNWIESIWCACKAQMPQDRFWNKLVHTMQSGWRSGLQSLRAVSTWVQNDWDSSDGESEVSSTEGERSTLTKHAGER